MVSYYKVYTISQGLPVV